MISIIISSYKPAYYEQVVASIKETIGVPYEIIKIDNPGLYGLTKAYNMGAERAAFDILCFIHEDIVFLTNDWGKNALAHFNNNTRLGLIGVAGSPYKTSLPTGGMQDIASRKIHIIQHFGQEKVKLSSYKDVNIEFVKVLDGVLMIARKQAWQENRFDENIDGYHIYDIDFSLRIAQNYLVAVAYDMLIEHFSPGVFGSNEWINATIKFHNNKKKQHLFEDGGKDMNAIRSVYYQTLQQNTISLRNRVKYVANLGLHGKSIFHGVVFLLPAVGSILLKMHDMFRHKTPKQAKGL